MQRPIMAVACFAVASAATLGLVGGGGGVAHVSGRTGGSIRAVVTQYPDHIDPALSYTAGGWQTLWAVYTPLLTYRHAAGAAGTELVPGLATALPQVSADGRSYRLKLRAGLKYSDATSVKASDFEHTIKRVLYLRSGGSALYMKIEGAKKYVKEHKAGADLSGIQANDATGQITIRLTAAEGSFSNILAMSFAGLVPDTTPFSNLDRTPPPGVGPYRLQNVRTNRGYELVKVPGFHVDGLPQAKLDRIAVERVADRRRQTRDTIRNQIDYMSAAPVPEQIAQIRRRFGGKRYQETVFNSTYYYFLNHRVPPFNKKAVRQAVSFAIDKRALARLFGGLLEPGCNFLPPAIKGYEAVDPCPYGDARRPPHVGRAKALIRRAGAVGTHVAVYGNDEPESRSIAEYMAGVLNQIGLKASLKIVKGKSYYPTIANSPTAQIGAVEWFEDFPHPSNFMFLVDGSSIQDHNNANLGFVDDKLINSTLEKADRSASIDQVAHLYAEVDKRLVQEADLIPYGHRKRTLFLSARMDLGHGCVVVHPVYNVDFTSLCLK